MIKEIILLLICRYAFDFQMKEQLYKTEKQQTVGTIEYNTKTKHKLIFYLLFANKFK